MAAESALIKICYHHHYHHHHKTNTAAPKHKYICCRPTFLTK